MDKIRWDGDKLRGVRENAALYNLDMRRGRIADDSKGGYWVHVDAPLFGSMHGYQHADKIHCADASVAEGELLHALFCMQKAERIAARTGVVYGKDSCWVTRTPLTSAEIADYRTRLKHAADMKRYADELAHVLDQNRKQAKATAGVEHLNETYGVTMPVAAMPSSTAIKTPQAPNAQHRRSNRK